MSSIYHQARKDIRALASFMSGLTALDVELEKLGGFEKVKLEAEARVTAAKARLTNILKGGQGWGLTREEAANRTLARAERLAAKKNIKNVTYLSKWLEMAEKWPNGCTIPNHRNGDAMGDEFMTIVRELVASSKVDVIRQIGHGERY